MKKTFLLLPFLILFAACGGNSKTADVSSDSTADITTNPDYQKGLALVAKSNCLTCHKVDEKLVGPAYKDVAAKYAGKDTAVTYLAHKVISGGKGVWGETPMTSHLDLSEADAEQMVKYILLLK